MSRPTPSMAISLLALFVALGGTGYAATRINGRDIADRSIAGSKLERNTLGGAQIKESRLGKVRRAHNADLLDGLPSSAFLPARGTAVNASALGGKAPSAYLAATGTAVNADKLDGKDSTEFLPATGTAVNADELDGKDSTDFLPATGTAVNADELDGKDSTAFLPSTRVQGAGPVVIPMPATSGDTTTTTLASNGPLTLVGQCQNSGGSPVATVGLQNTAEFFLTVGEADTHSVGAILVSFPIATHAIAHATPSGQSQWDSATHTFSAVTNPDGGSLAAMQGSATAIASNGPSKSCYVAAWAFAS